MQNLTILVSAILEIWLVPTKNFNASCDLNTPLSGMASTCYHQSTYHIWSLYF